MISVYNRADMEGLRKRKKLDPRLIRRLRASFFRSFSGPRVALAGLPEAARSEFEQEVRFRELEAIKIQHSTRDGASKLGFRTVDGRTIESVVLRIQTGRSSVCVSSQTGCAGSCLFCATGRLKGGRNLTAAEILDQVVQAGELLQTEGRRLRNVVFMGMGEPLHNEENLHEALEQLCSPEGFHLSGRHCLVSTLGIPDAMLRLGRRFPTVGMAVSVHCARQETRDVLMPLTRRWPLPELRGAIQELNQIREDPVMIEVLMLEGVTDTETDFMALRDWLTGLRVHVNLIPYNALPESSGDFTFEGRPLRGSSDARLREFLSGLKQAGFKATRRYSLGSDIQAACGQLAERAGKEI